MLELINTVYSLLNKKSNEIDIFFDDLIIDDNNKNNNSITSLISDDNERIIKLKVLNKENTYNKLIDSIFICDDCKILLYIYIISKNDIIITKCSKCCKIKIFSISNYSELINDFQLKQDLLLQINNSIKDKIIKERIKTFIENENHILKIKNDFNQFQNDNNTNGNLKQIINDFNIIINCIHIDNRIKKKIIEIYINKEFYNIDDINNDILVKNIINLFDYSLDSNLLNHLLLDYSNNKLVYLENLTKFISYYKNKQDISDILKSLYQYKQINSFKLNFNNNENTIIYLYNFGCKNFYYYFNKENFELKIIDFNLEDINNNIIKIYFINRIIDNNESLLYFIGFIVEKDFRERIILLSYNIILNKTEILHNLSDYFNNIVAFDFINNYNDIIYCGQNDDDIDFNKVFICQNIFSQNPDMKRLFYSNQEPSSCCNIFTNVDLLIKNDRDIFFSIPDSLNIYNLEYKTGKKFKYYDNFLVCLKGKFITNELYANLLFDSINYNIFLYIYDIRYYELISKIFLFDKLVIKELIDEEVEVTGDININENGDIKVEFNILNVQYYNPDIKCELHSEYLDDISEIDNCDLKGEYIIHFSNDNFCVITEKISVK